MGRQILQLTGHFLAQSRGLLRDGRGPTKAATTRKRKRLSLVPPVQSYQTNSDVRVTRGQVLQALPVLRTFFFFLLKVSTCLVAGSAVEELIGGCFLKMK